MGSLGFNVRIMHLFSCKSLGNIADNDYCNVHAYWNHALVHCKQLCTARFWHSIFMQETLSPYIACSSHNKFVLIKIFVCMHWVLEIWRCAHECSYMYIVSISRAPWWKIRACMCFNLHGSWPRDQSCLDLREPDEFLSVESSLLGLWIEGLKTGSEKNWAVTP